MVLLIVMFSSFEGLKLHDAYLLEYEHTETVIFCFPIVKEIFQERPGWENLCALIIYQLGQANFLMLHEG